MGEIEFGGMNDNAAKNVAHSRIFNMAFVDGHVESVRTNILFGWEMSYLRRWNTDHEP
jgi:prepilin-type processing-associated H-X9-DG protein